MSLKKKYYKLVSPNLRKSIAQAGKAAYGAYARGVHNAYQNEKRAVLKQRARVKKTGMYFDSSLDF